MPSYKHTLLICLFFIFTACSYTNPYKSEKVSFKIPQNEVEKKLHLAFDFGTVTFSGISVKINGQETVDLKLVVNDPKFNSRDEIQFAREFAAAVKGYITNIKHFTVISVDTKVRKNNSFGYSEKMKKTLFDQETLNEITASQYFHQPK